jgi:hypothetical protein
LGFGVGQDFRLQGLQIGQGGSYGLEMDPCLSLGFCLSLGKASVVSLVIGKATDLGGFFFGLIQKGFGLLPGCFAGVGGSLCILG